MYRTNKDQRYDLKETENEDNPSAEQFFESKIVKRITPLRKYLTTKEAAAYLGKSEGAIRNLVYRGTLIPKRLGKRLYFSIRELDRAIEQPTKRRR